MAKQGSPLSDLSFFRFPELTSQVVGNIVLLVLLLALTVLATVLLQKRVQRRQEQRAARAQGAGASGRAALSATAQAVLRRLMRAAQVRDEFAFTHDSEAFEGAVHTLAESADADVLADLAALRHGLHLNVMNAQLALVSTRQLLPDLPVRIVANIGEEKLDLYCALLRVDERFLLIDLPEQDEIRRLLESHPDVFLIYWREREGEAVFRVHLEPVAGGALPAFRARHALRDSSAAQRSDFRLTAEQGVGYRLVEAGLAGRAAPHEAGAAPGGQGEGRLIDLSYGGASLVVPEPLEPQGLLQLAFDLHGSALRLMLEVLTVTPQPDGRYLLRGQFRGLGEATLGRLHQLLYREQLKRLRDKELLHVRPGA